MDSTNFPIHQRRQSVRCVGPCVFSAAFGCFLACSSGYAHEHSDHIPADVKLGTVSFGISCKSELQPDFNRAIALLHSFWHGEAQQVFEKIAAADPNCAIAYWGEAMSHFHLGLSWPTPADLTAGAEALNKADAATEKTPREAAYIRALRALYDNFKPENSWVYSQNYAEAMAQLGAAYPSDLEAKVFYALALILAQPADDVDLVETKQAVQVLTPLLQEYPDHPGYAIVQARFPTMFAIETHDWIAAAHSEPLMGDEGSGRSLTLLAHAIAAGHLRDHVLANATLQATQVLMKEQMKGRPLPRSGTAEATFMDEIHAWTDFSNGNLNRAVRLLRPIADRQDKVGKGELDLPVREMMAEMLLIDGKTDESLREYQASLKSDPNRFNGLLGAAKAAEQLGQRDLAVGYYRSLLTNSAGGEDARAKGR